MDSVVDELERRGVRLWADGPNLRYAAPPGALTADLLRELARLKPVLLDALACTRERGAGGDPSELSPSQARLWFLQRLDPKGAAYTIPLALELSGPLSVPALEQALGAVVRRHEVLRLVLESVDGWPRQRHAPPSPLALPIVDLSALPEERRTSEQGRQAQALAAFAFDLEQSPLFRFALVRRYGRLHALLGAFHHIVFDAQSLDVLRREVELGYRAAGNGTYPNLPELRARYAEVVASDEPDGAALDGHLDYWRRRFDNPPPVLRLRGRELGVPSGAAAGTDTTELPPSLVAALRDVSRRERCTLFMTLLAGLASVLSRSSGETDITIGTPVSGRDGAESQSLIGLFLNTLALRIDLDGDPSAREILRRVRETALDAYEHRSVPFERVVEALRPERSLSHSPLFQVMFSLQDGAPLHLELPDVSTRTIPLASAAAKFELTVVASSAAAGALGLTFEYRPDWCDRDGVAGLASSYVALLAGMAADPSRPLSRLPLLEPGEREQIVSRMRHGVDARPCPWTIHALVARQAAATPDATALLHGDDALTYRELDRRASRLASTLARNGAGPEGLVAVCLPRSVDLLVGLLGVLKTGAGYVPLDPAYPAQRLALMVEDSSASVLLTKRALDHGWAPADVRVLQFEHGLGGAAEESRARPTIGVGAGNVAYVLYTSGSTGRPKGVAIEHGAAARFLLWAREAFDARELTTVVASTSVCFDLSIFELFAPLVAGGTVLLVDDALAIAASPGSRAATLVNTVPSAAEALVDVQGITPSIRTVNLAGERLSAELVNRLRRGAAGRAILNLYGPTEATTYATAVRVPEGDRGPPTIGRPLPSVAAYVVDDALEPVPPGVSGELVLGGLSLARGYLGAPELTATRFVPNPFGARPGARVYLTGDIVRERVDGELEFCGRIDDQIKLRGRRIELGEIEAVLNRRPEVRESAAALDGDEPGSQRLVAVVVPEPGHDVSSAELREQLRLELPGFMVPSAIGCIGRLPRTARGKIDRRALPAAVAQVPAIGRVPPRTKLERRIAAVWCDVLGLDEAGVRDSFFELGGNSLQLLRVHSRLQTTLDSRLEVIDLFRYPTIATLASFIASDARTDSSGAAVERAQRRRHAVAGRRRGADG